MCFIGDNEGSLDERMIQRAISRAEKKRRAEAERLANQVPPAPNPFAVLSSRIGIQRIEDVRPGERGRRVSVSDVKVGLR